MKLEICRSRLACMIFSVLCACQPASDHIKIKPLHRFIWPQNQKLSFDLESEFGDKPVDLLYQVQLDPTYSYQNIWLTYWLISPAGDTLTHSKDNLMLFQTSGRPIGSSIKERMVVEAFFLKNVKLPQKGMYRLNLQHYMRQDSLRGIQSIGIRWQESEAD